MSASADIAAELRRTPATDADRVLRIGAAALKAGLYAEALPLAEAALRADPGHARLWQFAGLLHHARETLAPAVEAFARAAELAPTDARIAFRLASARLDAGLPAVDSFLAAVRLAPDDDNALLGLAAAHSAAGDAEQAIGCLEQRLSRNPGWLKGHEAVAQLRRSRGESRTFGESFERALRAAPGDVAIWRFYVDLLIDAERHDDALSLIARARTAAGEQRAFDLAEAVARSERGEVEVADPLFARLLPLGTPPLNVRYVRHLLRAGRPDQAIEHASSQVGGASGHLFWPYLSAGWRLTGDPRWAWLEGDSRFVGTYDLSGKIGPIDRLADLLRSLHATTDEPLHQSVRGGTQTSGRLFTRIEPEIQALRRAVVEAVETHVAQLPPPEPDHPLLDAPRAPIRFLGSWSVRLASGGHHSNHVHPAGWLSSALYVALPGAAEAGPAPAGWLSLGEVGGLDLGLPPVRQIEPKPGRLVLFPSSMWHGTLPFRAGERLTVAFDVARPR